MVTRPTLGLLVLLGLSLVIQWALHWFVVCRTLHRYNARWFTGLLFWRVFHELRAYREICKARTDSLTFYYVSFILSWFNLLLALGTALRILWEQNQPPGLR